MKVSVPGMKKLLFIAWGKPQFKELRKLAVSLRDKDSSLEILFLALYNSDDNLAELEVCREFGFQTLEPNQEGLRDFLRKVSHLTGKFIGKAYHLKKMIYRRNHKNRALRKKKSLALSHPQRILHLINVSLSILFLLMSKFGLGLRIALGFLLDRIELKESQKMLKRIAPDLVVIPEESVQTNIIFFTKAARELKIPCFVYPFCLAGSEEFAEVYYTKPAYDARRRAVRKVFSYLFFKEWLFRYRNRVLIPLPLRRIFFFEFHRLTPNNPWSLNSGFISGVLVESIQMFLYYEKEGVPRSRLHLTGSIDHDIIAKRKVDPASFLENNLDKMDFISPSNSWKGKIGIVACAIPPDQFGSGVPELCKMTSYLELLTSFIDPLKSLTDYLVVFSFHPSSNFEFNRNALSSIFPEAVIYKGDVTELICASDLYIASVSSTIRTALTAKVPVLNYDAYQYRYSDFTNIAGVETVYFLEEYISFIEEFIVKGPKFLYVLNACKENAFQWGLTDGKATERIFNVLSQAHSP